MDIQGQLVTSGSTYEVGLCGHLQILIFKPGGLCTTCPGGESEIRTESVRGEAYVRIK
jgi:hypothetical protein